MANSRRKRSINKANAHRVNETTRYVELILVNDYAEVSNHDNKEELIQISTILQYANHSKKRKDLVFSKSQQIANIVNAVSPYFIASD